MPFSRFLKELAFISTFILVSFFIVTSFAFGPVLYDFVFNSCMTEMKQVIRDPRGLEFEISDTNCDAIAKWEEMSIFVSKAGSRQKTEIFKFDPVYWAPLPKISVSPKDNRISISVPKISSIYFKKDRWDDMIIDYQIGDVTYPDPDEKQNAHSEK